MKEWANNGEIKWFYNPTSGEELSPFISSSANFTPLHNDYLSRMLFKTGVGVFTGTYRLVDPNSTDYAYVENLAEFQMQSALVFSGTKFSISKPVTNSFAMVSTKKDLGGVSVKMNPSNTGYEAKSRPFLPGVLSNLIPYSPKRIRLELENPPIGTADVKTKYVLLPGYKTGFSIELGKEPALIVMGKIVDKNGKPIRRKAFEILSIDSKLENEKRAFSSRYGKFQVGGIYPGKYMFRLVEYPDVKVIVDVSDAGTGFVELGKIVFDIVASEIE